MATQELTLRYGCNPHQKPARIFMAAGDLPLTVLNGAPGYINLLDALNSWQLVRELRLALNLPAAASFKHVSPAGAAVAVPMSDRVKKAGFVDDLELTPLATAYARARGADRLSSFGDWAALSDIVDVATAKLLKREVSDGVIAPGFEPEALQILREKREGKYSIIQIDPTYNPPTVEQRTVFGISFEQKRNDYIPGPEMFNDIVTAAQELPASARRDLIVAQITLKYTQSNSVCFAFDGQVIGVGAGQQSRIHCTRLAGNKADRWFLRQHPTVLGLPFSKGVSRTDQNNAIDLFLEERLTAVDRVQLSAAMHSDLPAFEYADKKAWLDRFKGVALASDAFFPFRDNIDRAHQSGVSFIVQPGGSVRDDAVIAACDEYGMVMAFTKMRLFHH
jgi:phosphoribosylaminoimidazolecarboxamide formyltransferase/IMP cyclohydrolase